MLAFDRFDSRPPEPLGVETEPPSTTAPKIDVRATRNAGLGDTTYLLPHTGLGVVVDSQRDVERFFDKPQLQTSASDTCWKPAFTTIAFRVVASSPGARRRSWCSAGAGVAFDHAPTFHLEDLEGERLVVRPIHTPGHTPEHLERTPGGGSKDYPPGCGSGQCPCAIPEMTQVVCAREAPPDPILKGAVLCHRGAHWPRPPRS